MAGMYWITCSFSSSRRRTLAIRWLFTHLAPTLDWVCPSSLVVLMRKRRKESNDPSTIQTYSLWSASTCT